MPLMLPAGSVKIEPQGDNMAPNPIILYVEDDFNNRLLIRRVLMAEGFQVLEAPNAAAALQILKTTRPDLILMDINMPDMDGYNLTAEIRGIHELATIPIVAVTANVMRGDRERTLEAGCDGYIQKPVDIDALPFQLHQYIQEARND
jgi:two-component system cell cycle response regulator DivK